MMYINKQIGYWISQGFYSLEGKNYAVSNVCTMPQWPYFQYNNWYKKGEEEID